MGVLNEERKKALMKETEAAAAALVSDLSYLRRLLTADQADAGEVRRMSAILRRYVVEAALTRIANPRIGKLVISSPDFKPIYVASRQHPPHIFVGASTAIFGMDVMALAIHHRQTSGFTSFDPEARVDLNIESFGKQNVLLFNKEWISRTNVIEYIANVDSGVHAGQPTSPEDHVIKAARHAIRFSVDPQGLPKIEFTLALTQEPPAAFGHGAIDAALLLLLSTASPIVNSPSVLSLERTIKQELGLH